MKKVFLRTRLRLSAITLFSLQFLTGAISQELVPLSSGDILVSRTDRHNAEFLPESNPDDAPLLMEYGFRSLLVRDFQTSRGTTRMEIYQMGSPEAAFGMFSVSAIGVPFATR